MLQPDRKTDDARDQTDALLIEAYDQLRRVARALLSRFPAGVTLQPTVLVHEAYVRLAGSHAAKRGWSDRRHFINAAALAIRRELLSRARRKRRHASEPLPLVECLEIPAVSVFGRERIGALEQALSELERDHPAWAQVVMFRWYLGLSIAETAEALGMGERTVSSHWQFSRAWLQARVDQIMGDSPPGVPDP